MKQCSRCRKECANSDWNYGTASCRRCYYHI